MPIAHDPYGEPSNAYEREAKRWLLEHNGTEGQAVMKSLAELIWSFSRGLQNQIDARTDQDERSRWRGVDWNHR
jgi:hypothetical protein